MCSRHCVNLPGSGVHWFSLGFVNQMRTDLGCSLLTSFQAPMSSESRHTFVGAASSLVSILRAELPANAWVVPWPETLGGWGVGRGGCGKIHHLVSEVEHQALKIGTNVLNSKRLNLFPLKLGTTSNIIMSTWTLYYSIVRVRHWAQGLVLNIN